MRVVIRVGPPKLELRLELVSLIKDQVRVRWEGSQIRPPSPVAFLSGLEFPFPVIQKEGKGVLTNSSCCG